MIKNVIAVMATLALGIPVMAQSIEDEILIEAESAMADSEAALQEAEDAEKITREEKRKSQKVVAKAKMEIERARKKEAEGKRRIAKAERDRVKSLDEADKASVEMATAKASIESVKEDIDLAKNQLEEANSNRSLAIEKKEMVLSQLSDVKKDLKNMKKKLSEVKKEELSALKDLQRAETRLQGLQEKAQISYKNADKDSERFLSLVKDSRETLRKISKRLDELEVEVETDRNYYAEERRNKVSRKIGSTMKRTATKVARVMATGCNIRNSPTSRSTIVGKSSRGKRFRIRNFNKGWYSVVHDGQKAFMGKGCFRN